MSEMAQIISQLGFPIFVAVWMLYKTSKDSEALKDTIADLKNSIAVLTTLIQDKDGGNK
mgnify:FL=1